MTPYYDHDGITIYHGDCRDVLPTLDVVDCVITSPPYNTLPLKHNPSGLHGERKTGVNQWIERAVRSYADNLPEAEYQKWLVDILQSCYDNCRGLMWVNHKIRYRDGVAIHPARFLPWPIHSEVIWNRNGSMALNCRRYAPSTEHLLAFGTPHYWNDSLNKLMSVWSISFDREKNDHPCAYPVELVVRPLLSSTREQEVVLDPFMGSGTTLRVARNNNRKAIGIEIEEKYCEIAAERLRQGVLEFSE